MAYLTLNIESRYLNENTEVGIILPDRERKTDASQFYRPGMKYKVLWLLHGGMGDYSDWIRKSMAELYACENELMVVMPSAMNSGYTKWENYAVGFDMYDYIIKELMPLVYGWFPASDKREDNFIAGLSMGGWGAAKLAVNHPGLFAGAAVLSSTVRNFDFMFAEKSPDVHRPYANIIRAFGGMEGFHKSEDYCTKERLREIVESGAADILPGFFFGYGNQDPHLEEFEDCMDTCRQIGLPFALKVYPGYAHEWRMWDLGIQDALRFFGFPLPDR